MGDDNTYTITIGEADSDSTWSDPNMTYTFDTSLTDTASQGTFAEGGLSYCIPTDYGTRNLLHVDEIEQMCNDYPSLKIAYEKFKHVYDLVYQDWKGKQEE
tara:strand:+ start:7785 stop:8087 length:303 start_codon:yes stop_codon:yes gene_type:complete